MVRYLFYTIGDLTYQSPLVVWAADSVTWPTDINACSFKRRNNGTKIAQSLDPASSLTLLTHLTHTRVLLHCESRPTDYRDEFFMVSFSPYKQILIKNNFENTHFNYMG